MLFSSSANFFFSIDNFVFFSQYMEKFDIAILLVTPLLLQCIFFLLQFILAVIFFFTVNGCKLLAQDINDYVYTCISREN